MLLPGPSIATGGGTVLDPVNRWSLWEHSAVAWLDVPPDRLCPAAGARIQ